MAQDEYTYTTVVKQYGNAAVVTLGETVKVLGLTKGEEVEITVRRRIPKDL